VSLWLSSYVSYLTMSSLVPLHPCDLPKPSLPLLPQSLELRARCIVISLARLMSKEGIRKEDLTLSLGWDVGDSGLSHSSWRANKNLNLLESTPPPPLQTSVSSNPILYGPDPDLQAMVLGEGRDKC
jgi:hypothetical protein